MGAEAVGHRVRLDALPPILVDKTLPSNVLGDEVVKLVTRAGCSVPSEGQEFGIVVIQILHLTEPEQNSFGDLKRPLQRRGFRDPLCPLPSQLPSLSSLPHDDLAPGTAGNCIYLTPGRVGVGGGEVLCRV